MRMVRLWMRFAIFWASLPFDSNGGADGGISDTTRVRETDCRAGTADRRDQEDRGRQPAQCRRSDRAARAEALRPAWGGLQEPHALPESPGRAQSQASLHR